MHELFLVCIVYLQRTKPKVWGRKLVFALEAINKTIVFYDGKCRLCRKEIDHYRRCDTRQLFDWVDIQFDRGWLSSLGIAPHEAARELHVLRWDGVVVTGASAFASIWIGLPRYALLGKTLYRIRMLPIANWFYRRFLNLRSPFCHTDKK